MKNRILIVYLFISIGCTAVNAQNNHVVDSLSTIYNNEHTVDTLKLEIVERLFKEYMYYDQSKAAHYLEKVYVLAKQMDDDFAVAKYFGNKGILFDITGQLDSSKLYYYKAIEYFEKKDIRNKLELVRFNLAMVEQKLGNNQEAINLMNQNILPLSLITQKNAVSQSISYGLLSRVYSGQGYFKLSLNNALTALKIIKTTDDELRIAGALNDLANIESALKHYQNSIDYQLEAIALYEKHNDKYFLANAKTNLGGNYFTINDIENAIKAHSESLALAKEVGSASAQAVASMNLGEIFIEQDKLDLAGKYLEDALNVCKEHGLNNHLSHVHFNLGKLYQASNQNSKALSNFNKSLSYAEIAQNNNILKEVYFSRAKVFEETDDYKSSLIDYKKFHAINDSIFNTEQISIIEELRILNDLEQKEKEIELLAKNVEIDAVKKNRLWILLGSAIGIGSILLWSQWRRRRKEKLIHLKEREIETEKRKVTELENEQLNQELDFKKQELTSKVLQLCRKNEFLQSLDKKVKDLKLELTSTNQNQVEKLSRQINRDIEADSDWEQFLKSFESVHPNFNDKLNKIHPTFTAGEIRLTYLLKMNLGTKEIASLLNITSEGVKKARQRMRKKMAIDSSVNLAEYFINFENKYVANN